MIKTSKSILSLNEAIGGNSSAEIYPSCLKILNKMAKQAKIGEIEMTLGLSPKSY